MVNVVIGDRDGDSDGGDVGGIEVDGDVDNIGGIGGNIEVDGDIGGDGVDIGNVDDNIVSDGDGINVFVNVEGVKVLIGAIGFEQNATSFSNVDRLRYSSPQCFATHELGPKNTCTFGSSESDVISPTTLNASNAVVWVIICALQGQYLATHIQYSTLAFSCCVFLNKFGLHFPFVDPGAPPSHKQVAEYGYDPHWPG